MAINLQTLKDLMPKIGLTNFEAKDESTTRGRLIAGFQLDSGDKEYPNLKAGVSVSLQEDGEFVQVRIVQVIDKDAVLSSEFKPALMQFFLQKNYENKIGRWCLDSNDGDVYVDWAIAVEDNPVLTERQLQRLLSGLVSCVKEAWGPMRRILATGSDVQLNADDLIKEILLLSFKASRLDLGQAVGKCTDVNVLARVKLLIEAGKFEDAKVALASASA